MLKRLFLSLLLIYSCSSEEEDSAPPPPPVKYTLTTAVNPAEGGTITPGSGEYNAGTTVTITASPAAEYVFKDWTGAIGTTASTSIVMSSNKSVTANFVKKQYPLTVEIEGEGSVEEKVIKQGLATDYNSGTLVELTAEPTGEWEFVEWTGDIASSENQVQIKIDGPKTVKAKFVRYFDYKVPSFIWKNNTQPRFNLREIEKDNGINEEYISNTGSAYADFNGDGYFDIMSQGMAPDGTDVGYDFFINNGDGSFKIDNSFFNSDFKSDKARKTIVGDFNNDDKPDVVRISGQHDYLDKSNITLSNSDGTYVISDIDNVPISQYHGFASGDIDNDGDLDIFFGSPAEDQGFAFNNGDGTFVWKNSCDVILNCDSTNWNGAREQVQTIELFDFNKDGNLDIIMGGQFNNEDQFWYLDGPTILWGDGSGNFNFNNKSLIFEKGDKPYAPNSNSTCNLDDFVFGDVNGDGINEIIMMFMIDCDKDGRSMLEIYSPNSQYKFERVTNNLLSQNLPDNSSTWIQLRDIDGNNFIDLVQTEIPSWRYEWNGSKFEKKN